MESSFTGKCHLQGNRLMRAVIPSVLVLFFLGATKPAAAQFACAGFEPPSTSPTARAAKMGDDRIGRGGIDALVVFAQFRGETPQAEQAPAFAADLFDPEKIGSLAHFYDTMSFGQFHLRGQALPKRYRSRQLASTYLTAARSCVR